MRFLLAYEPEGGRLTERSEPQSLHDPHEYVSGSLGEWPTPTAILLGADGLLAGGPVTGSDPIDGVRRRTSAPPSTRPPQP